MTLNIMSTKFSNWQRQAVAHPLRSPIFCWGEHPMAPVQTGLVRWMGGQVPVVYSWVTIYSNVCYY